MSLTAIASQTPDSTLRMDVVSFGSPLAGTFRRHGARPTHRDSPLQRQRRARSPAPLCQRAPFNLDAAARRYNRPSEHPLLARRPGNRPGNCQKSAQRARSGLPSRPLTQSSSIQTQTPKEIALIIMFSVGRAALHGARLLPSQRIRLCGHDQTFKSRRISSRRAYPV